MIPADYGLKYPSFRPGQKLAIWSAIHAKVPHVVIQAPTGSGKSAVALAVSSLDGRSAILTASKGLQAQYLSESPSLIDIRGSGNYVCLAEDDLQQYMSNSRPTCDDGPCHSGVMCALHEDGCLYFDQLRLAKESPSVLTNYDYWIAMRRYSSGLGTFDYLLCDEAHSVPDRLMSACRISLPKRYLPHPLPASLAGWKQWAERELGRFKKEHGERAESKVRHRRYLDALEWLANFTDDAPWAWETDLDGNMAFEPISAAPFLKYLSGGINTTVHLSATITPATLALLGIKDTEIRTVVLDSQFPVSRRPIWVLPSPRVDFRMKPDGRQRWLDQIDQIISARQDRKGIIHTVSYDRADLLLKHSRFRGMMLAPRGSVETVRAVEQFRKQRPDSGTILVSPAITTGYDFPYCIAPESRVLRADLRWIRAGELGLNDRIAAFDEFPAAGRRNREWREAIVTSCDIVEQPCFRLWFEDGTNIVCSKDHMWLVSRRSKAPTSHALAWVTTESLRCDGGYQSHVAKLCDVWNESKHYSAGYLAAAFDGEGSLYQSEISKLGSRNNTLSFTQRDNRMLRQVQEYLDLHGIGHTVYSKGEQSSCSSVRISHRFDMLRVLGSFRPRRLLPKFRWDALGRLRTKMAARLVRKEFIGERRVVALKTSTSTLIVEGLASHNCDAEYQLIIKMPFPDTRSVVTKARIKNIPGYRDHLTMQSLVQAAGRINRASDDSGETLIVDGHAGWFLKYNADLAPRSFLQALRPTGRIPPPLPKL